MVIADKDVIPTLQSRQDSVAEAPCECENNEQNNEQTDGKPNQRIGPVGL
jgi:hypothetical protein